MWNKENRICGWADVDLSERGIAEAREIGRILKKRGFVFDIAFTSMLRRAIKTAWFTLDEMDLYWIPIIKSWRLNERHYGELEGLAKSELAKKFGIDRLWGKQNVPPPALRDDDRRHPRNDPRYRDLREDELPSAESRDDVLKRILPYWHEVIRPRVESGEQTLIVTHGDVIRTLAMYISSASDEKIPNTTVIPTGTAIVYEFDDRMNPARQYNLDRNMSRIIAIDQ